LISKATFPEIIQFGAVLVQIAWKPWTKITLKIENFRHNRLYPGLWISMCCNVWLKADSFRGNYSIFGGITLSKITILEN